MRVLITGIGGQDGRLLSELLHQYGFEITGTTRSTDQLRLNQLRSCLPESVDVVSFNLSSYLAWDQLLSSRKFDIIFHLAAQSSVGKSFREPLFNILNPTEICFNLPEGVRLHQPNAKVVFAGSTEVFGSHGSSLINEVSPKQPMSPYAAGKLTQEAVISFFRNSYDMCISNAYLSNHESLFRGDQFVTMKIVKAAFSIFNGNLSVLKLGNVSVVRDWGWAPEYMEALFLLSKKSSPEDLIIATGQSISLLDFVKEVFNCFGLSYENHVEYDPSLLRTGDPSEVHYDPARAKSMLGWAAASRGADVPKKLACSFQKSNCSDA